MKNHKTEAIILDTTDVFDADRSLLLFTRELGKIRARARGVRKPTSKLTGHLLVYLPTQLELSETGGNTIITGAQVVGYIGQGSTYPENSLLFQQQATIIAEMLNRLFTEDEPHPEVYDGLCYTLERLRALCGGEENSKKARFVTVEFLVKCLADLGYSPELKHCVITGEVVTEDFIAWSSQLGGVLSREGYEQNRISGMAITSARTIVVLRQFLTPGFWAERLQLSDEVRDEVCRVVYHYAQTQIGQPLRALF